MNYNTKKCLRISVGTGLSLLTAPFTAVQAAKICYDVYKDNKGGDKIIRGIELCDSLTNNVTMFKVANKIIK